MLTTLDGFTSAQVKLMFAWLTTFQLYGVTPKGMSYAVIVGGLFNFACCAHEITQW